MKANALPPVRTVHLFVALAITACLTVISKHSYLLFHTLVELFSVAVACGISLIAWNTRRSMKNNYFFILGVGCLFVGFIDLLHTLAYKNMGVFNRNDANLATQLWVASRYLQSATLVAAPLLLKRKINPYATVTVFSAATLLLVGFVFTGAFPDCYTESSGLTSFKKGSEYVTALLLAGSLLLLRRNVEVFAREVVRLLYVAISLLLVCGLAFTLYTDVFGIMNAVGHYLKLAAYFFIYKGLIEIGLTRPYDLLFRELKKSEEALLEERNELRESEERYRHLYKDTPVMLHSIDRDGRIVNVSNYWLEHLGYTEEEVLCRKSVEFFTEASRKEAEKTFLPEFFLNGFLSDVPYQVVKKNGEVIDVLLSASCEKDEKGNVGRSFSVMIDVTERNRAEEKVLVLNRDLVERANELQAANSDLEAFNYTVSHDLRGPLGNIGGCCSVIRDMFSHGMDERGKEFLTHIENEVKKMDQLIGTLLRFSRLGRQELLLAEVNLSNMATVICLELKMRHPDRHVEFSVAENMKCRGDSSLLRIVLENLIGNAWKYTGMAERPSVTVGMTEAGGSAVFFVRDNGAGFDQQYAEKLFVPFQRLHGREFEGFGIGLATVQKIICRHGGNIWAQGETGKGATFFFSVNEAPATAAFPADHAPVPQPGSVQPLSG